jgi:adenosylhomocysteine nucleosidase
MEVEIRHILTQMENAKITRLGGIDFHRGLLADKPIVLALCGVGKVNAAHAASMMTTHFEIDCMINVGVAGGIGPNIGIGDVVISSRLVQHDFDISASGSGYLAGQMPGNDDLFWQADKSLADAAKAAAAEVLASNRVHLGPVATGDQFINQSEVKAKIWDLFAPLCVEMEGAAMAQICAIAGTPFVAIRAISDKADGEAHEDFPTFVEEMASISSAIVIKMLMRL